MFKLHEVVTLSHRGEVVVAATAESYGTGYVAEIAEASGVPLSGTIYRVSWYEGVSMKDMGIFRRTIFREDELVAIPDRALAVTDTDYGSERV